VEFWSHPCLRSSPPCAHQQLRPILPYMAVLLNSPYGMIVATAMDLNSYMSSSDRQNRREVPLPGFRLRKPQVWISTSRSDPIKLMLLVWMVCTLYARILIASSHHQMRVQTSGNKVTDGWDFWKGLIRYYPSSEIPSDRYAISTRITSHSLR
jgi:hypothetical protein